MNLKKMMIMILVLLLSTLNSSYAASMDDKQTDVKSASQSTDASDDQDVKKIADVEAKKFVMDIGNKIIQILVDRNHSLDKRKDAFRQILQDNFNITAIGRFVLGKHWREMNDDQQGRYLKLFEDAIVDSYSEQFDNYDNEKLQVLSAQLTSKGSILVKSEVLRPQGGESLKVDWQVFKTKLGLKIHDIIVNGVSMSITQRTAYAGIIQREGGVSGLLNVMQNKSHEIAPKITNEEQRARN